MCVCVYIYIYIYIYITHTHTRMHTFLFKECLMLWQNRYISCVFHNLHTHTHTHTLESFWKVLNFIFQKLSGISILMWGLYKNQDSCGRCKKCLVPNNKLSPAQQVLPDEGSGGSFPGAHFGQEKIELIP